eukprot:sb/3469649/
MRLKWKGGGLVFDINRMACYNTYDVRKPQSILVCADRKKNKENSREELQVTFKKALWLLIPLLSVLTEDTLPVPSVTRISLKHNVFFSAGVSVDSRRCDPWDSRYSFSGGVDVFPSVKKTFLHPFFITQPIRTRNSGHVTSYQPIWCHPGGIGSFSIAMPIHEKMIRYRYGNELFSLCRYDILIQNCLKNRSITGPKLYLKREKFYSCFKLVTIFSCHPLEEICR